MSRRSKRNRKTVDSLKSNKRTKNLAVARHGQTKAIVKPAAIIAVMLLAVIGFGAFMSRNNSRATNPGSPPPVPLPSPQYSANSPAVEHIYAGGKLLAVSQAPQPVPADIAVWRPSNGNWIVMGQTGSQATTFSFGMSGDIPVPGDFDGDGKTDFSVFRPSDHIWYIQPSGGGNYYGLNWGISTDLPAEADYS